MTEIQETGRTPEQSTDAAPLRFEEFQRVEIRVGTIVRVDPFPEARRPAWQLTVDLGPVLGVKRSSAQITALYTAEDLVGRQVVCVVNFPPKRIGPFLSELLVTGFYNENGHVVLAVPERPVPNGARLA